MTDRQSLILEALINEYIRTAKPVGSAAVLAKLEIDLSPATVRNEMQALEESGYLFQPHASAGRIPTDKGYRYHIDRLRRVAFNDSQKERLEEELIRLMGEYRELTRSASCLLARMSRLVTMCSALSSGETTETGLSQLLQQPDADMLETVREVSRLLDDPAAVTEKLSDITDDETVVYVGRENPYYPAEHTSLIVRSIDTPQYGRLVFMIAGPKRMSYRRHVNLLDAISDILHHNQDL